MESLEQIVNWIFGGQVDASKIISIIVAVYAVIKSITEWVAKKKLLQATQQETTTQKKLEEARNVELVKLVEKAKKSQLPEDSQAANDYANYCDRFEKKLHDLELTRMICVQMGNICSTKITI